MTDLATFGFGIETAELVKGGKALDEFADKGASTARKVGKASDDLNKELRGLAAAVNALVTPTSAMAAAMQRTTAPMSEAERQARAAAAEMNRLQGSMAALASAGTTPLQAALDRLKGAQKDYQAAQAAGIPITERHKAGLASLRAEVDSLRAANLSGAQAVQGMSRAQGAATAGIGAQVRQYAMMGLAAAGIVTTFQELWNLGKRALQSMDQTAAAVGRIGSALGSLQAGREVFTKISTEAQKTGTDAQAALSAFLRFDMAAKQIGATTDQTIKLTTMLQKIAVVSGTTAQESSSAFLQLGQALASGRFQGDELRAVLESMPMLAELLAKNLGVGIGQLRTMGSEGKLTSELVFKAILASSAEVEKRFAAMPVTMARAAQSQTQAWTNLLSVLDENWKITSRIATAMQAVADKVQNVAEGLRDTPANRLKAIGDELERINRANDEAGRLKAAQAQRGSDGYSAQIGSVQPRQGRPSAEPRNELDRRQVLLSRQAYENAAMEGVMWEQALKAFTENAERQITAAATARVAVIDEVKKAREALGAADDDTIKQMKALQTVIDAGPAAFDKYGTSAGAAAGMLQALKDKADPLARVLAGLNDALNIAIATNVSPLEGRVAQAQMQARPTDGTQQKVEDLTRIRTEVNAVAAAEQARIAENARREAEASTQILAMRRAGNEMGAKRVEIEGQVQKAISEGMSTTDAATLRASLLTKAQNELAGSQIKSLTPIAEVRKELTEQARASEHLASASALSAREQVQASIQDRARAAALKVAREGQAAYSKAYAEFLALVQRDERGKAAADANKRTQTMRDEIALLEREVELVGQAPEIREREIAALKIRQELLASGKSYTEDEIASLTKLAQEREGLNIKLREQQKVWGEIESFGTRAFDRIGEAVTQAFVSGKGAAVSFASVTKGLFSELIQMALKLAIINPLAKWAAGGIGALFSGSGGLGSLLGLGGGVAGAAGAAGGGGGLLGQLGQLTGLSNLLPAGGFSGMLASANASLFGTAAQTVGPLGEVLGSTSGLLGSGGALSLQGLLGGAGLGFGGGQLLNGLMGGNKENGMIGGGLGSLAGIGLALAIPGIGPFLAPFLGGLLGGVGGGLLGPGPSVKSYGLRLQSAGFSETNPWPMQMASSLLPVDRKYYNEEGDAYFKEADQVVATTNQYLASRGLLVGGVGVLGRNKNGPDGSGVGTVSEAFANLRFSGGDDARLTASLADKSFADLSKLQEWVEGFKAAAEAIDKLGTTPAPQFTQQVDAINKAFDEAIETARKYGLEESKLTVERQRQIAALQAERAEVLRRQGVSLSIRRMAAAGDDQQAQLATQAENATQEIKALTDQLDALAVSADVRAAAILDLETTLAAERAKIIRQFGEEALASLKQAGSNIRDWLDNLNTSPDGGLSPTDRFSNAQAQFERDRILATGGDQDALRRITGTADSYLNSARDLNSSGPGFQSVRAEVVAALSALPVVKSYDAMQTASLEAIQEAITNGTIDTNTIILPTGNIVQLAGGSFNFAGIETRLDAVHHSLYVVSASLADTIFGNRAAQFDIGKVTNDLIYLVASVGVAQHETLIQHVGATISVGYWLQAVNSSVGSVAEILVDVAEVQMQAFGTLTQAVVDASAANVAAVGSLAQIQVDASAAAITTASIGHQILVDGFAALGTLQFASILNREVYDGATNNYLSATNDYLSAANDYASATNDWLSATNDWLSATNDWLSAVHGKVQDVNSAVGILDATARDINTSLGKIDASVRAVDGSLGATGAIATAINSLNFNITSSLAVANRYAGAVAYNTNLLTGSVGLLITPEAPAATAPSEALMYTLGAEAESPLFPSSSAEASPAPSAPAPALTGATPQGMSLMEVTAITLRLEAIEMAVRDSGALLATVQAEGTEALQGSLDKGLRPLSRAVATQR